MNRLENGAVADDTKTKGFRAEAEGEGFEPSRGSGL